MATVSKAKRSIRGRSSGVLSRLGFAGSIGLTIVIAFLIVAIAGPLLIPHSPVESVGPNLEGPSIDHWFGTDALGRDMLSRVVSASGLAIVVGLIAVGVASVVGTLLGVTGGFIGGKVDWIVSRGMDVLFAFPALILALAIAAGLGPGVLNASIAIGVVYIPRFARVARAGTLSIRTREYIEAARLAGKGSGWILFRHVVPNIASAVLVLAALSMATAQLNYSALSFLGLGSSPPQADFGSMLSQARVLMTVAPWLVIVPAVGLSLLVVGLNLLGDGIRDVLDPKNEVKRAWEA